MTDKKPPRRADDITRLLRNEVLAKAAELGKEEKATAAAKKQPSKRALQKRSEAWTNALEQLPASASYGEELEWIRNHPIMNKKALGGGENIRVTPINILKPMHGPAPCRSAAISLQHWANHPEEFMKKIWERKKKEDDATAGLTVKDLEKVDSLQEAESHLKLHNENFWKYHAKAELAALNKKGNKKVAK